MTSPIRCAIYTRKSSEEGLEQGFNTLDAQYEACAAYVASQKHEGWKLVRDRYDDGGFSGGNTDRPALQRLLAEVDAERVSMIVVYKIDRLTRSLADFARLVERLEAKGCSFVSVTQAFNTSTSMGRLTLNVLLSFAQFEREVAGERIRDKIAASKKRGLWMGGTLPLGYDRHPDPRAQVLVVNDAEAATVSLIFDLYEQAGCLRALTEEVQRRNLRSKARQGRDGREIGNRPFGRGQLHYLLTNPVYRGRTRHGGADHEGQHPAIIDEDQWSRVQALLQQKSGRGRGAQAAARDAAPLTGKLVDETGDRLTPTHTAKGTRRYRYYVSNRMISGPPDPQGWRLPAASLEAQVAEAVRAQLARAVAGHTLLAVPDLSKHAQFTAAFSDLAHPAAASDAARRGRLLDLVESGTVGRETTALQLRRSGLAGLIGVAPAEISDTALSITATTSIRRRGVEARLVIGERPREPDPCGGVNRTGQRLRAGGRQKAQQSLGITGLRGRKRFWTV